MGQDDYDRLITSLNAFYASSGPLGRGFIERTLHSMSKHFASQCPKMDREEHQGEGENSAPPTKTDDKDAKKEVDSQENEVILYSTLVEDLDRRTVTITEAEAILRARFSYEGDITTLLLFIAAEQQGGRVKSTPLVRKGELQGLGKFVFFPKKTGTAAADCYSFGDFMDILRSSFFLVALATPGQGSTLAMYKGDVWLMRYSRTLKKFVIVVRNGGIIHEYTVEHQKDTKRCYLSNVDPKQPGNVHEGILSLVRNFQERAMPHGACLPKDYLVHTGFLEIEKLCKLDGQTYSGRMLLRDQANSKPLDVAIKFYDDEPDFCISGIDNISGVWTNIFPKHDALLEFFGKGWYMGNPCFIVAPFEHTLEQYIAAGSYSQETKWKM